MINDFIKASEPLVVARAEAEVATFATLTTISLTRRSCSGWTILTTKKKLESDDDEAAEPATPSAMADSNGADVVHGGQQGKGSQHYNYYEEFKSKPVIGFDDEDR